jgi:hypothetical protein
MDSFLFDELTEEFIPPRQKFLTFDYETGYMHATEDCRTRRESMVIIILLLISLLATLLILIVRPMTRRKHL